MTKEEKIDILKDMVIYYNDVNEFTDKEKKEFNNFVNELKEAINYTRCYTELLCVDKEDDNAITKGYRYKCIEEDNTFYKIVDNYGDENWFLKKYFKKQ